MGSLSPRGHGLRATALPFLEDLHHATGQHVLLAVRDDHDAVLVERLSAHHAGRVLYRVGGRLPLHGTGVGRVLLAHAPAELQHEVLAGNLTLPEEGTSLGADELRRILAHVRTHGIATASRPYPDAMSSVAAPVRDTTRDVIAALSVVAPTATMNTTTMAPAVVAVARAVSRAMRERGSPDGSPGSGGIRVTSP